MTASNPVKDWTAWWRRHSPALLLFARTWTDTLRDAEDALQEGFIRFYRNRESAVDSVALVYTCVKRAALDQSRGDNRRSKREQSVAENGAVAIEHNLDLFQKAEDEERRREIEQALSQLPDDQRQTVVLKIWSGLTFPQIGDVLGISPNTAASRYRYALEKLRNALSAELMR